MKEVLKHIKDTGILPILTLDDAIDAIPIGQALHDGGIPNVVITYRSGNGPECISLVSKALPNMLVGAGTVFTTEQVDSAIEAGARFITSPSINPTIVEYCQKKEIPIFPGVSTPSDIEAALTHGLEYLEYFPAIANGGLTGIQALSVAYPQVQFMANGGLNNSHIVEYLADPRVFAIGGSWLVKPEWIEKKEYDKIEIAAREAIHVMLDLQIDHVGVNFPKEDVAIYAAEEFAELIGRDVLDAPDGFFAGPFFEAMKPGGKGVIGHVAFSTNSVERAKSYLESRGFTFDEDTIAYNKDGLIRKIYLEREIGGMALQLVRKDIEKGSDSVSSGIHPVSLDSIRI